MPLNLPEPAVPAPSRVIRFVVAGIALVALLFAVAMVARSGKSPARNRVETAASDDQAEPNQPPSQRLGRPTAPQVTGPTEPTPSAPAPPTNQPPIAKPPAAAAPTAAATTSPTRPTTWTGQEPTTPEPTALAGPTGPTGSTKPTASTEMATEPIGPLAPTGPTDEQKRCANLRLVAVGDPAPGDDAAGAAKARFRSAMAQIPPTEDLVCGKPVARYLDDLLVQQVQVAGKPYGVLVGGTNPSNPVLWLSEVEWTSYQWRTPGSTNHNFTGVPVGRVTIGGHQIIRTSRGGVVMVRADSWGHTVIGGAWDVWMARGGPTGPMGLPEAKASGTLGSGVHQDFTNGVLTLPGVSSDLEAEVMPASRYVWLTLTAEQLATPPPAPNTIQDVNGVSYYVDHAGMRHWIETTSAWGCAHYDLGATEVKELVVGQREPIALPGWQAARAPLGPVFTCPPKPPA